MYVCVHTHAYMYMYVCMWYVSIYACILGYECLYACSHKYT